MRVNQWPWTAGSPWPDGGYAFHDANLVLAFGSTLFELDGQNAQNIYTKNLGPFAERLPESGLLFPMSVRSDNANREVVRTAQSVSEEDQSVRVAGDICEGTFARFTRAIGAHVIDGAAAAASSENAGTDKSETELALVVSCVARRMACPTRIADEFEDVESVRGRAPVAQFNLRGEMAPACAGIQREFRSQTKTITLVSEA